MDSEAELRKLIRARLPPEALINHPWRVLWALPLVTLITLGTAIVARVPMPWPAALALGVLIGNLYGSLFFWGHELAHGAMIRDRRGQDVLLFLPFLIYCLSPHLWRVWHHQAHHAHTNVAGRDPDNFGTLEDFRSRPSTRFLVRFAPGSRHWLSAFYLFTFFTLQSWGVLLWKGRTEDFRRLDRTRALLETLLMIGFWGVVAFQIGARATLFAIVVPMMVANAVILSYIVTNHMMRPLTESLDTLATTMSVTTWKALDHFHFHFSHHVEHHFFPNMATCYAPAVRAQLRRFVPDRYLAPPHLRALVTLFGSPRLYADAQTLADPYRGERMAITHVEARLRGGADAASQPSERRALA